MFSGESKTNDGKWSPPENYKKSVYNLCGAEGKSPGVFSLIANTSAFSIDVLLHWRQNSRHSQHSLLQTEAAKTTKQTRHQPKE